MISINYIADALIKAKYEIFGEKFITISELNKFNHFIQQEFNNQDLGIVITSDSLSNEYFKIIDGVIIQSEYCFNIETLPSNIFNILNNHNLIAKFFIELESEKLSNLEKIQENVPQLSKKIK